MDAGDEVRQRQTVELLLPMFYADLQSMARRERNRVGAQETLRTTALINEAYLKLRRSEIFQDRRHFLCCAAIAMRQVLVNHAEARRADKRGAGAPHLPLEKALDAAAPSDENLLEVHEALLRLEQFDPRMAQLVMCRFFAGYDEAETAEALGISERTVRRDWIQAKAWLYWQLHPTPPAE
ncbi:MAG TPA: ECF-type sigma factor [Nevskia sp.]|nr:ECF-type sigma factor [Nevskia sp.]